MDDKKIRECVKQWIENIRSCFKRYGKNGLYSVAFECPKCGHISDGIQHGSMKCINCKFIIPKEYRPPLLSEIIEFEKEDEIFDQFEETIRRIRKTDKRIREIESWK